MSGGNFRNLGFTLIAETVFILANNIMPRIQEWSVQEKGGKRNAGEKYMAKIKCYAISCSSDSEADVRQLYVWGAIGSVTWLPSNLQEARKRIKKCQRKEKCDRCDFQIHRIEINRTKLTKRQLFEASNKEYRKASP